MLLYGLVEQGEHGGSNIKDAGAVDSLARGNTGTAGKEKAVCSVCAGAVGMMMTQMAETRRYTGFGPPTLTEL